MSSFSVARSAPTRASTDQLFLVVLGATAVLKLFLAAIIPLTGDEAYFLIWGRFPDYGYYDHGAMTGWWTALTLLAGKSVFLVRLPAVITALLGAFILRGVFQSIDPAKANSMLESLRPMDDMMRQPGAFGPKIDPPQADDPATRLLNFVGRKV